jgi:hypothetical protein
MLPCFVKSARSPFSAARFFEDQVYKVFNPGAAAGFRF